MNKILKLLLDADDLFQQIEDEVSGRELTEVEAELAIIRRKLPKIRHKVEKALQ